MAVLAFEVLLNGTAMFSHSNAGIPVWLDRALRLVFVTPDMHRVHHSVIKRETNSNFGFNLPWMLLLPFVGKLGGYPINRDNGRLEPHGNAGKEQSRNNFPV